MDCFTGSCWACELDEQGIDERTRARCLPNCFVPCWVVFVPPYSQICIVKCIFWESGEFADQIYQSTWSMFTWNLDMSRLSGLSFLLWIQRNLKLWLLIPARWIISDATLFAVICHFHPAEPLGPLPTSGYNLKAPLRPFIQHRLDPTPISLDPTPSPPDPSLPRKVFLAEIVVTADCIVVVSHPDKSYQMKAHHRVV